MSVISDALTRGLSFLATAKGESVSYRLGTSGSFTALVGFVLTLDRVQGQEYDDNVDAYVMKRTGILKGPVTPQLGKGYQIKDNITGLTYAVEDVKIDVQQVCPVMLIDTTTLGPDRKGAK
jgi:hypothetical protein